MHVRTMIKADYSHTRNTNEACAQTHARGVLEHVSLKASAPHQRWEGEDARYDRVVAEHGCDEKARVGITGRQDHTVAQGTVELLTSPG